MTPQVRIFAVDWGMVWEVLEGIGLTAAISRGGYAAWRKLSGDEKYYKAILMVLDDATEPLPKYKIMHRVDQLLNQPARRKLSVRRMRLFDRKFNAAWIRMREAKIIGRIISGGENLYFLNEATSNQKEAPTEATIISTETP